MNASLVVVAVLVIVAVLIVDSAVRVLREYERGVIFRLGRLLAGPKGPGLILLVPFGIDRMVKTDLRTVTLAIPPQEVITKDNVPVRVTAVTYFRVVDPQAAVTQIENYLVATSQIAQTTLRSVLGQHSLDELLAERDKINEILQDIIDKHTAPWGIKISVVEVKDVELPTTMQRAMARQAEAERERRAKIIGAQGEYEAAEQLSMAADRIAASPIALQLRYLQTLLEISSSQQRDDDPADPDRHPAPAAGRGGKAIAASAARPACRRPPSAALVLGLVVAGARRRARARRPASVLVVGRPARQRRRLWRRRARRTARSSARRRETGERQRLRAVGRRRRRSPSRPSRRPRCGRRRAGAGRSRPASHGSSARCRRPRCAARCPTR